MVGNDLRLPWGADVKAPVLVVLRPCTLLHGRLRANAGNGPEVQRSPPLPSAVGDALVPALSASDVVVVPAPSAALVTSAAEITGYSTTSVSGILLPNASWSEAFLPLSDVVGGALHMRKDLD
jgi:hypothetical protein